MLQRTIGSSRAIRLPVRFRSTGQREGANFFMVNGADVEESVQNGASIVPTLDSIEEFRLLTNSFNAEYGRFSGAIVNVVTKSGTNEIHGSVYEFLAMRNSTREATLIRIGASSSGTSSEAPSAPLW